MNDISIHRLNTSLHVEYMVDKLNIGDDIAVTVLNGIMKSYLIKGGVYDTTLNLKNSKDMPREIVVKLYDDINKPDKVWIRAIL